MSDLLIGLILVGYAHRCDIVTHHDPPIVDTAWVLCWPAYGLLMLAYLLEHPRRTRRQPQSPQAQPTVDPPSHRA